MTDLANEAKIGVVVADDHPIVRSGIVSQLASHPDIEVLGQAVDGDDAVRQVRKLEPDVLVLDISMPGLRAVDVLHELNQLEAPPHVLILTAHNDIEHILALLKAGAKGYLLKDEEPSVISVAVCAVAEGKTWLSTSVMASMIDHTVKDPERSGEPDFTEREMEVLQLLAEGRDNQAIADALTISERTVRYHLRNIYGKLGVQRRGEAIAWAARQHHGAS